MIRLSIIYVACTVLYMAYGTGSMYWALFNMVSVLGCAVGYMNYSVKRGRVSGRARAYTRFAAGATIARLLYSFMCVISPVDYIYLGNKIFAGLLAASFIAFIYAYYHKYQR